MSSLHVFVTETSSPYLNLKSVHIRQADDTDITFFILPNIGIGPRKPVTVGLECGVMNYDEL